MTDGSIGIGPQYLTQRLSLTHVGGELSLTQVSVVESSEKVLFDPDRLSTSERIQSPLCHSVAPSSAGQTKVLTISPRVHPATTLLGPLNSPFSAWDSSSGLTTVVGTARRAAPEYPETVPRQSVTPRIESSFGITHQTSRKYERA
ncbi:AAEL006716-PA [Aedes aegypti]|uniref:AAEL006716-PA n=1 Tax=Aedes aegypti TaxID=7159 RepID=Q175C0_AEDAE|nr:AAEL006716-PA [Aedes aegypti]